MGIDHGHAPSAAPAPDPRPRRRKSKQERGAGADTRPANHEAFEKRGTDSAKTGRRPDRRVSTLNAVATIEADHSAGDHVVPARSPHGTRGGGVPSRSEREPRAATIDTPMGAVPRCQARCKATGEQCQKAARRGCRVCSSHGAGTRRRERSGRRLNPVLAPLKSGRHATPATLATWEGMERTLAERVEHYRADRKRLRDLDELLARVWAVNDILSETKPEAIYTTSGLVPPPVLGALRALAEVLEKSSRIEVRLRVADVPLLESQAIKTVFLSAMEVFRRHLPPESAREAMLEMGRIADAKGHGIATLVEQWRAAPQGETESNVPGDCD